MCRATYCRSHWTTHITKISNDEVKLTVIYNSKTRLAAIETTTNCEGC
jgi:hypothetical protein